MKSITDRFWLEYPIISPSASWHLLLLAQPGPLRLAILWANLSSPTLLSSPACLLPPHLNRGILVHILSIHVCKVSYISMLYQPLTNGSCPHTQPQSNRVTSHHSWHQAQHYIKVYPMSYHSWHNKWDFFQTLCIGKHTNIKQDAAVRYVGPYGVAEC